MWPNTAYEEPVPISNSISSSQIPVTHIQAYVWLSVCSIAVGHTVAVVACDRSVIAQFCVSAVRCHCHSLCEVSTAGDTQSDPFWMVFWRSSAPIPLRRQRYICMYIHLPVDFVSCRLKESAHAYIVCVSHLLPIALRGNPLMRKIEYAVRCLHHLARSGWRHCHVRFCSAAHSQGPLMKLTFTLAKGGDCAYVRAFVCLPIHRPYLHQCVAVSVAAGLFRTGFSD